MTLQQSKHLLKVRMNYERITSTGHTWSAVPTGWKDLSTSLIWKYEDEEGKYTFDEAVSRFGETLPTREEYEEAESHGVREVLSFEEKYYWSSSLVSSNRNGAWVFFSGSGFVNYYNRGNAFQVRCVGR